MNTEVQVFRYLKGFALLPSAIGPKISHHPTNHMSELKPHVT